MTPEALMVNLGALFAAGHSPADIGNWTWAQVHLAAEGIQLYHIDLANRLITGKSAASGNQEDRYQPVGDETEAEAEYRRIADIQQAMREFGGFGFSVKVTPAAVPTGDPSAT